MDLSKEIKAMQNLVEAAKEIEGLVNGTSPASSARMTGLAPKQSASSTGTPVALTENQAAILRPLVEAIMASIKSTPSTPHEWRMTWDGSSILLRMWLSPTNSGSNVAGNPGPVVPEYSHIPEQRVRPEGETP
jgi:hypothetical protein